MILDIGPRGRGSIPREGRKTYKRLRAAPLASAFSLATGEPKPCEGNWGDRKKTVGYTAIDDIWVAPIN